MNMVDYYKVQKNFKLKRIPLEVESKTGQGKFEITKNITNLNIGTYLLTPIFLGVIIGYYLDKYLNKQPFFIVLFIILGTISTFYNLVKLVKESQK